MLHVKLLKTKQTLFQRFSLTNNNHRPDILVFLLVKKEDDQEDSTKEEEGKAKADKEHDELPDTKDGY